MQNKLQELTEKLYNEGLSKGKEEGERLIAQAKEEAAATKAAAKAEAEEIIAAAKKEAEAVKAKAESDIKMASAQALQATRKDIENLLLGKISAPSVDAALKDADFLKEIIRSVAANFSSSQSNDISLVLPESLRSSLEPWVAGEMSKEIGRGIKAEFSKKIAGGFTIAPAEGGWFVSLSDGTFKELIAEYLRPVTRKLLFGE